MLLKGVTQRCLIVAGMLANKKLNTAAGLTCGADPKKSPG